MTEFCLANGVPIATVSLHDRGLAYGDGLFETVKVVAGIPEFMALHMARLQDGCQRLGLRADLALLLAEIDRLIATRPFAQAVLKIIVTRGDGPRGYQFDDRSQGNRYLSLREIPPDVAVNQYQPMQAGVKLKLCRHRLPINPALAGIKHLNRLDQVIARAEWRDPRIHEGLMMDSAGRIVEGTMSNLFVVAEGRLMTPSLNRCGVDGVIRQVILQRLAGEVGVEVTVVDLTLDDLYRADELMICNSLIGICPVLSVDCLWKSRGPVTLALQRALGACH